MTYSQYYCLLLPHKKCISKNFIYIILFKLTYGFIFRYHSNSNGKNRRQNPSSVLHFFNAPPNISETDLSQTMGKALKDDPKITIKMFPPKGTEARSSSGLVEFTDMATAVEVIMAVNHWPIKCETSKFPYLLRLCFSSLPKGIANAESTQ